MTTPREQDGVQAFEAKLREHGLDPTDVYDRARNIAVGYLDDVTTLLADVATTRKRGANADTQDLAARTIGAVLAGVGIALGMDRSAAGQETGK